MKKLLAIKKKNKTMCLWHLNNNYESKINYKEELNHNDDGGPATIVGRVLSIFFSKA